MKKGHTQRQWEAKFFQCGCKCSYCELPLTLAGATKDHLTPTKRGGSDEISNIAPACFRCNVMKGNRTVEEFLRARPVFSKAAQSSTAIGEPMRQASALLLAGKPVQEKPKPPQLKPPQRIDPIIVLEEKVLLRQIEHERNNVSWWRSA